MLWQLELLIWSMTHNSSVKDGGIYNLNPKDILVIFITNQKDRPEKYQYELSNYAKNIISYYGVRYIVDTNNYGVHSGIHRFSYRNSLEVIKYCPLNKPCSLAYIWEYLNREYGDIDFDDYKFVVILEADLFAFGELNFDKFPKDKTSIAYHWLIRDWTIGKKQNEKEGTQEGEKIHLNLFNDGTTLIDWMKAAGISKKNIDKFVPGACIMWIRTEDFTPEFIDRTILWTKFMLYASTLVTDKDLYISELPAYSLALAHCGVDVELIDEVEFHPGNMGYPNIPLGSLIHYTYGDQWPLRTEEAELNVDYFNKRCYGSIRGDGYRGDGRGKSIFDFPDELKRGLECESINGDRLNQAHAFFEYCLQISKNVPIDRTYKFNSGKA